MSKAYDFLQECGAFYVLTVDGDAPAGRPFGAVMEYENDLFVATANTKDVYRQMKANGNVQIVASKPGTREWIRISGTASECADVETKQRMLDACPILHKHYDGAESPRYAVFRIKISDVQFN